MTPAVFIEPLDVLYLRGNKLFGDPGSYGESLVPPWPSVAAGALRSRMLVDAGVDLTAFAAGEFRHTEIGTPGEPGLFTLTAFHLARRLGDGEIEILTVPPADLVVSGDDTGKPAVHAMVPTQLLTGPLSSAPLPLVPVLAETARHKPQTGYLLTQAGWIRYLAGQLPAGTDLVSTSELWAFDHRVGVGLDVDTRRAADGRLFSAQAVAMRPGVGFVAMVRGGIPPRAGMVRFGGDGRAAAVQGVPYTPPEPDCGAIAEKCRCRLVLTSPGIFEQGWLPTGAGEALSDGSISFHLHGIKGRVVCAAVPRAEWVSGWDLARQRPKSAQQVAPTGSVYWLELDQGVTPAALRKLVEHGLWSESWQDEHRRAEGFNRITLACY